MKRGGLPPRLESAGAWVAPISELEAFVGDDGRPLVMEDERVGRGLRGWPGRSPAIDRRLPLGVVPARFRRGG